MRPQPSGHLGCESRVAPSSYGSPGLLDSQRSGAEPALWLPVTCPGRSRYLKSEREQERRWGLPEVHLQSRTLRLPDSSVYVQSDQDENEMLGPSDWLSQWPQRSVCSDQ